MSISIYAHTHTHKPYAQQEHKYYFQALDTLTKLIHTI